MACRLMACRLAIAISDEFRAYRLHAVVFEEYENADNQHGNAKRKKFVTVTRLKFLELHHCMVTIIGVGLRIGPTVDR